MMERSGEAARTEGRNGPAPKRVMREGRTAARKGERMGFEMVTGEPGEALLGLLAGGPVVGLLIVLLNYVSCI